MKQIVNMGRTVGLSAHELYVRQTLAEFPEGPVADEKQWLASSLASGASMLCRVGITGNTATSYIDVQFPTNSTLCAANPIVASFFGGVGELPAGTSDYTHTWATDVVDYGRLISNTDASSPNGDVGTTGVVPTQDISDWTQPEKDRLLAYTKIIDGIIIQPGNWTSEASPPPAKHLTPNMTLPPRLRLMISEQIKTPFWILLTGFTIRSVATGITKMDTYDAPQDGDFLGPGAYPWASKVTFSLPTAFVEYFMKMDYVRQVPSTAASVDVKAEPIIDFDTSNPNTFYQSAYTDAPVDMVVNSYGSLSSEANVLTTYQKSASIPAALYGTKITASGANKLAPLDTHAPNTVKLFNDTNMAMTYQQQVTYNKSLIQDTGNYVVRQIKTDGQSIIPVADVSHANIDHPVEAGEYYTRASTIQTGDKKEVAISLTNSNDAIPTISARPASIINISGDPLVGTNATYDLNWSHLMRALANNKRIDILGTTLKRWRNTLVANDMTTGKQYAVRVMSNGTFDFEEVKIPAPIGDEAETYSIVLCDGTDTTTKGQNNYYPKMQLDVFMYKVTNDMKTVNSFATVSCIGSGEGPPGPRFAQPFFVPNTGDSHNNLREIRDFLRGTTTFGKSNHIQFTTGGRPLYHTGTFFGAPMVYGTRQTTDSPPKDRPGDIVEVTMYINVEGEPGTSANFGKGVLYAGSLNGGGWGPTVGVSNAAYSGAVGLADNIVYPTTSTLTWPT